MPNPAPFIAGANALAGVLSIGSSSEDREKQEKAIEQQIAGLKVAHKFSVNNLLARVDQIASNAGMDSLTRLRQARREAGQLLTLNASAGAHGATADSLGDDAYVRAGEDVGIIQTNASRAKRATFSDIFASRLTLKNQVQSLNAGIPSRPNPLLQALSIGLSAADAYQRAGGFDTPIEE